MQALTRIAASHVALRPVLIPFLTRTVPAFIPTFISARRTPYTRRHHYTHSILSTSISTTVLPEVSLRERLLLHKLIYDIAAQPIPNFQKTLKNGHSQILENANESLKLLLILTTRRLCKLSQLPYISLMNPHMAKIWSAYLQSYSLLVQFTGTAELTGILSFEITKDEQNENFKEILKQILAMHEDNIIDLKQGMKESALSAFNENEFLNEHLRERILMRLIANNHIALTDTHKGMLYKRLNILEVLARSVDFVGGMTMLKYYEKINIRVSTAIIDGSHQTTEEDIDLDELHVHDPVIFPYFEDHLEYVFNEMLKNASRAVIERNTTEPVDVLVVLNNTKQSPTLQIKISDRGGGIPPDIINKLWEYSFTTVKSSSVPHSMFTSSGETDTLAAKRDLGITPEDLEISGTLGKVDIHANASPTDAANAENNAVAGMGYGLPLSLTYCRLFDGDIKLQSVWGKGTDVYLTFRGL